MPTPHVTLDLRSLRADGGRVECTFVTPDGQAVRGAIEKSFFEEFLTQPKQILSPMHTQRIVSDNAAYLAAEAERQLRLGHRNVTIV
jgi:hypothetical protein